MGMRQRLLGLINRLLRARSAPHHSSLAVPSSMTAHPGSGTRRYVSWLEDAARLRPARETIRAQTAESTGAPRLRAMRFVAETRRGLPLDASAPFDIETSRAPSAQPSAAMMTPEPAPVTPDVDFLAAPSEVIERLSPEQRKLLRIRFLVQRGVYNEGFTTEVPEQYQNGQGTEENPSS